MKLLLSASMLLFALRAPAAEPLKILDVVTGYNHSCVLFQNGRVKCWGNNGSGGQLGRGPYVSTWGSDPSELGNNLPYVDLGTGVKAKAIDAGAYATCVLLEDDSLKCWGRNGSGELGLGDTNHRGDNANEMGDSLPRVNLGTGRTARAFDIGVSHACAVLDTGEVKCWGSDRAGQLGQEINRFPMKAVSVDVGEFHSCALLENGEIRCWGDNAAGQLGGKAFEPVSLGKDQKAVAVEAGMALTCALLDTGAVKCWGSGATGGLGLGPVSSVGRTPESMGDNLPELDLGGIAVTQLSVGDAAEGVCALFANGTLLCWGYNDGGQLGRGDTINRGQQDGELATMTPIDLGRFSFPIGFHSSGYHACAILDETSLTCWGWNFYGQTALPDKSNNRGSRLNQMATLQPIDLGTD